MRERIERVEENNRLHYIESDIYYEYIDLYL
jgi:hypothetical protein